MYVNTDRFLFYFYSEIHDEFCELFMQVILCKITCLLSSSHHLSLTLSLSLSSFVIFISSSSCLLHQTGVASFCLFRDHCHAHTPSSLTTSPSFLSLCHTFFILSHFSSSLLSSSLTLSFFNFLSVRLLFNCFPLSSSISIPLSLPSVDDNVNISREFHDQRVYDE